MLQFWVIELMASWRSASLTLAGCRKLKGVAIAGQTFYRNFGLESLCRNSHQESLKKIDNRYDFPTLKLVRGDFGNVSFDRAEDESD